MVGLLRKLLVLKITLASRQYCFGSQNLQTPLWKPKYFSIKGDLDMKLAKTELRREDFGYKATKLQKLLEEFLESGENVMEITEHNYKNAGSAQASLYKHILRFREPVEVATRKGRIYLIKKDI